ncbi:MAG: protein kinase, partial [Myxococcales bacterium]|nr:protein kinase [Myxococcales bacterium]
DWLEGEKLSRLSSAQVEAVIPQGLSAAKVAERVLQVEHEAVDPLVRMREEFRPVLVQRIDALVALFEAECLEAESVAEAERLAHRLRGSAGSYGFHEVSNIAGQLEDTLRDRGPTNCEVLIATLRMLREQVRGLVGRGELMSSPEAAAWLAGTRGPGLGAYGGPEGATLEPRLAALVDQTLTAPTRPESLAFGSDAPGPAERTIPDGRSGAEVLALETKEAARGEGPGGRVCEACQLVCRAETTKCGVCARALPPVDERLFDGRYRRLRKVGSGSMGTVWKAEDVPLNRPVALKFLAGGRFAGPRAVRRFQQEAAALASIRHDHVAQVYSFGLSGDALYFSMEFVHGKALDAIIAAHARYALNIPVHRALVILRDVASGLSAVHAADLVHRDVKPENVIIETGSGRAVVVDFGLALATPEGSVRQTGMQGTPAYMAPEQIAGDGEVTRRTDVYALGCTAFELLTNHLPFESESVVDMLCMHELDPPPAVSSYLPELAPFDAVIRRALAKDPADRWPSAAAMVSALMTAGRAWMRPGLATLPRPSAGEVAIGALRILVVDDDEDFVAFAARAAELALGLDADIVRAESGHQALTLAAEAMPHLVILDYGMPGIDGIETLSRLRELPQGDRARVIATSASSSEAMQIRFHTLGVEVFLQKPIETGMLIEHIRRVAHTHGYFVE